MRLAIDKAERATVGCVWVRNTNVFTMASHYSRMALTHDFVGFAMCNGVPLVAPWGGRDPIFNTSPVSFAIPAGQERPVVFDGSVSSVSHGRVVLAARDGLRLAEKWLIDPEGVQTDDPGALIANAYDRNSDLRGAILPLGPKGFAGLILVDVLTGLLAGMSSAKAIPLEQSAENPWNGGLFFGAINIGNLVPVEWFKGRVDQLIRDIKSGRLADGFQEIVLPGERAAREMERRRREGVPVREEDWQYITQIAAELGIDLDDLRARLLRAGSVT
jgi:LDH2 family malate/lactate/ureidoglycolate dehydrogenase